MTGSASTTTRCPVTTSWVKKWTRPCLDGAGAVIVVHTAEIGVSRLDLGARMHQLPSRLRTRIGPPLLVVAREVARGRPVRAAV